MKKTTLILAVTLCVMLLVLGVAYADKKSSTSTNTTPTTSTATTTAPSTTAEIPATSGYTLATVATHNSTSSCWAAINGSVYDVTSWINQHPGGPQAILSLCGTDGSVAFNGQHGGDRRPASELASFRIGAITN